MIHKIKSNNCDCTALARFVEAVYYLEEQMDTKEVKANLNTVVQYNGVDYMFQGCIIRKNTATNEYYYQAELAREGHVVIVRLDEIERADGAVPALRSITRRQADNTREMLDGCLNRMFVSDDPEEIERMFGAALHDVAVIREYGLAKLERRSP